MGCGRWCTTKASKPVSAASGCAEQARRVCQPLTPPPAQFFGFLDYKRQSNGAVHSLCTRMSTGWWHSEDGSGAGCLRGKLIAVRPLRILHPPLPPRSA